MSERFDYIAIGPDGVYGLCEDLLGTRRDVREFIQETILRGHAIERVTVDEAVKRHREYLTRSAVRQAALTAVHDALAPELYPADLATEGGR